MGLHDMGIMEDKSSSLACQPVRFDGCRTEENLLLRHLKMFADRLRMDPDAAEGKLHFWKPESSEAAGLSEPSSLPGPPDSRSGGKLSAGGKEAGKNGLSKAKSLEYPPLGEVQLRGVQFNARSLVKLRRHS